MDKEKLINQIMADAEKDGEPVTREEAEEMAEMEIKANGIKNYVQDKPKKKDVQMITETELSFLFNSNSYSLKLIKHRPPK